MSALTFTAVGAHSEPYAAAPQLALEVQAREESGAQIYAIALRAQIRIEPQFRRYGDAESARLVELFGGVERYGETLRPLLWAHVAQSVLAFSGETTFDLPVPCSYDFAVAANKYLSALEDGEIPLLLLFSGIVFVQGSHGVVAELVPWTCEARYRLPVTLWRATMDAFFPNSAWLRIDRETFDELYRVKIARGFPTWEATLAYLIAEARSVR